MNGRAGFSLIEVLIVVAIVGILAGISAPRFTEMRDRAETAHCQGNLHSIFVALTAYKADFNRFPLADGIAGDQPSPGKTEVGNGPAANGSWSGVPFVLREFGYLQDSLAYYCPTMQRLVGDRAKRFRYAYNHSTADTGGSKSGAEDIEAQIGKVWLVRCVWLHPADTFTPREVYPFPHNHHTQENALYADGGIQTENIISFSQR